MSDENLKRYTVRLDEDVLDRLRAHYPGVSYNALIRHILSLALDRVEAKQKKTLPPQS